MPLDIPPCETLQAAPHASAPVAECGSVPSVSREIKSGWGGRRPGAGRPRKTQAPPITELPAGLLWFCVRTEHRGENLANQEIRSAGFTTFFPCEFRPADRSKRGRSYDRIVPLFPRYLFVQFNARRHTWRSIYSCRGVEWLFCSAPERPLPVPDEAIELIRGQCAPNDVIYPPDARRYDPIPVGAEVKILDGPLAGLVGVCQHSEAKRVQILVELFGGRSTKTEIRRHSVARV